MSPWTFVLASLAIWRVTHLLQAEDGPWDVVARMRRAAGEGQLGKLLDCFYCLSVWIAAPFVALFADSATSALLVWPALSAAAILVERITGRVDTAPPPAPPASCYEEPKS